MIILPGDSLFFFTKFCHGTHLEMRYLRKEALAEVDDDRFDITDPSDEDKLSVMNVRTYACLL